MNNIVKWLFRFLTFAAVLLLIILVSGFFIGKRSVPDYGESFTTKTDNINIEILRDHNAVPHIFGKDIKAVMFGLGVAHAQDRLWQMSMMRRISQGRLSEIGGADMVELDLFLRALNLWELAGTSYETLSPHIKEILQAYADGVNSYVAHVNSEKKGAGSPEFLLVDNSFAPWTPQDSIAILKVMALELSSGAENEILRTKLSTVLSGPEMQQFFYDSVSPVALFAATTTEIPSAETTDPDTSAQETTTPETTTPETNEVAPEVSLLSPTGYGREAGASNAFVVAPARSVSGAPILASDPHLRLSAPSIWHLTHLSTPDQDWVGGVIPGIPMVLIGHNNSLGWGLTTANLDDQDLVILKLSDDQKAYITEKGEIAFDSRTVYISVKGEDEPRAFTMNMTEYGPVLPPVGPWGLQDILPKGHAVALSWTGLSAKDTTIEALIGMFESQSIDEAISKLDKAIAPSQILTMADKNGNIAQIAVGQMPKRSESNASKGMIPAISWSGDAAWSETFPFSENPRNINPNTGLLIHTNNKFVNGTYPRHFSFQFGDNYRIRRAESLLGRRKIHSPESFTEAQQDTLSMDARIILPIIAGDLWFKPTEEGLKAEALKLLGDWSGNFDALAPEPLIYSTWIAELYQLIFSDELGPFADELKRTDPYRIENVVRDVNGASKWCDIKPTPDVENCQQISEVALDKALARLSGLYGDDISEWRWGHAHKAQHKHQTLGEIPIIGAFANIVQEVDGGAETLLRASSRSDDPFDFNSEHGGALRMVANFSDLKNTQIITSTGQSGNIFSPHYDDLSALWATGEYIDIYTDRKLIEGNLEGKMTITSENTEGSSTAAETTE